MSPAAGPTRVRRNGAMRVRMVLGLYGAGLSVEEIGHRLGLRSSTTRRILRDAGIGEHELATTNGRSRS